MPSDDLRLVFQLTQRGDLTEVRLAAPGGECRVETKPAAIFTAGAIRPGPAALVFSVWQDGGQIACRPRTNPRYHDDQVAPLAGQFHNRRD